MADGHAVPVGRGARGPTRQHRTYHLAVRHRQCELLRHTRTAIFFLPLSRACRPRLRLGRPPTLMRSPAAASAAALSAGEEVLEDDDLLRIILSALAPVGDPSSATADALRTAAALSKRWSALVKPITRRYLLSRAEGEVLALPTYGIPPGSFAKVMEFASFLNGRRRGRSCGLPEHIARSAFPESLSVPPAFAPGVSDATALGATQLITSFECGGIPALVEGDGGAEKVIACLTHFATKQMVDYLVICPSGRMQLWVSALQQLAPSIRVLVNQGTPTQRKNALLSQPRDYDLLLTPYSLAIKDTLHLCKLRWKVVVWDDGLSELRRGFREGSQTWALHQGVNKRAAGASGGRRATDYNILLSPARVTNADDLLWLVHNHLGATYAACKVGLDAHAIAMRVIVQKLGLLEIAPASLCTEVAREAWLASLQHILDQVSRPTVAASV